MVHSRRPRWRKTHAMAMNTDLNRACEAFSVASAILLALVLDAHVVLGADRPPLYSPKASCRSSFADTQGVMAAPSGSCIKSEETARDLVQESWDQFSAADKAHCQALVGTGGQPSYVELLSCMEMARDARNLAKDRAEHRPGLVTEPVSEPPADGIGARRAAAAQRSDH